MTANGRTQMNSNGVDVWSTIVGKEYGPALQVALQLIAMIPAERLIASLNNINRVESIGPYIDPTAWIDGARFRNAGEYKKVLAALATLRQLLPDNVTDIHNKT